MKHVIYSLKMCLFMIASSDVAQTKTHVHKSVLRYMEGQGYECLNNFYQYLMSRQLAQ